MTATLQDLRDTLAEAAQQSITPSGLDILASVEQGVARSHRRTVAAIGALAVAATAVAGAVVLGEGRREAATPSGPPVSGSVRVVTDDPTFAEFDRGFKRLAVVDLPVGAAGTVDLSGLEKADRRIYVWRYCTGTQGQGTTLRILSGGQLRYVDCPARPEATTAAPQVLWIPREAGQETVISTSPGSTATGTARVGFYQESPWDEFQFPPRPADLTTNPAYAWDPEPADVARVGPADPADPNAPRTIVVPYQERLGVQVIARGPGSVRMGLNGRPMNLYCEPTPMAACVGGQSIGDTFTTWAYGLAGVGVWFDNEPDMQVGKPVTVTIDPSHFTGDDWRVVLTIRGPD